MAVGSKHALLVAVFMLLVACAACYGTSSRGASVSRQGRKRLSNPRMSATTLAIADTEEENVDLFPEEAPLEGKQVREMVEAMAPSDDTTTSSPANSIFPEPLGNPIVMLQAISVDNAQGKQNEHKIQLCIKTDGCGTP